MREHGYSYASKYIFTGASQLPSLADVALYLKICHAWAERHSKVMWVMKFDH